MKILVVYKSKTGFTKEYAQWIGEELSCEILEHSLLTTQLVEDMDILIYGGRIHAGAVDGARKIIQLTEGKKCKLVMFATGATPNVSKEDIGKMWENNQIDDSIPHFYMQSGLRYEKMGKCDKLLMKTFARVIKSKKNKSESDVEMAKVIASSYDISSREYIDPLVECVRNLCK